MDFQLTEDQIAIRDLARSFATEVCAPTAADRDRKEEFPAAEFRKAAELRIEAVNHAIEGFRIQWIGPRGEVVSDMYATRSIRQIDPEVEADT